MAYWRRQDTRNWKRLFFFFLRSSAETWLSERSRKHLGAHRIAISFTLSINEEIKIKTALLNPHMSHHIFYQLNVHAYYIELFELFRNAKLFFNDFQYCTRKPPFRADIRGIHTYSMGSICISCWCKGPLCVTTQKPEWLEFYVAAICSFTSVGATDVRTIVSA